MKLHCRYLVRVNELLLEVLVLQFTKSMLYVKFRNSNTHEIFWEHVDHVKVIEELYE
jgi:hypothetical protein